MQNKENVSSYSKTVQPKITESLLGDMHKLIPTKLKINGLTKEVHLRNDICQNATKYQN